jgi:hypothetical protein
MKATKLAASWLAFLGLVMAVSTTRGAAQEGAAAAQRGNAAAQAGSDAVIARNLANPVAAMISVPFQNNLDFGGGRGDALRFRMNFQPVVPITLSPDWNLISRTILPFQSESDVYPSDRTGLGDTLQSFFLSPARPWNGVIVGGGPALYLPTATNGFGQRQWGAGPTGVVLRQSGGWTYGILANHIWSLGGTPIGQEAINSTYLQPFLLYNFPGGTTTYLNSESTYDWSRRQWLVPINAGVNQLVRIGGQPLQIGAGFRYYAEKPEGGPDWGVRLTVTFAFPR